MKTPRKNEIRKEMKMKRCAYCFSTEQLTIDHKHPKIMGGTDDKKNLQCLCRRCNQMKSGLPHGQLLAIFHWYEIIKAEKAERKEIARVERNMNILPDSICSLAHCTTCQKFRKENGFGEKGRKKLSTP